MTRSSRSTCAALVLALLPLAAGAGTVEYDLTIAREQVSVTGRPVPAMTINNGIPGPTLRFREGDLARIHVRNRMDVPTSLHWHGLLVPPGMDGVPLVSFPPIAPGATFTYEFPIRQTGTYWYHSHSALQEQSGVYGSIVILPAGAPEKAPENDHVVLLSDWTDDDPHAVLRTLRRGSEWFAVEKGSGQSILGAARTGMLGDYFSRELQRMPPMDIADVAYDRFLANGRPEITLNGRPGDRVRLRVIDGSATTYFHLEFSGGPMTIVAADGQDVEPVEVLRLLIGVAETYDLLVTLPGEGSYELRATAHDGSGFASVWIGTGALHLAPDLPKPNLYKTMGRLTLGRLFAFTPAGSMGMSDRDVRKGLFDRPGMMHGMEHGGHAMDHGMQHADGGGMTGGAGHAGHAMDGGAADGGGHAGHGAYRGADRSARPFGRSFGLLANDISSRGPLAMDGMDDRRPGPPYAKLRAAASTALPEGRPVREVRITLDEDMERYVWFLNNRPLSESDAILVRQGEVVRFIMINRTMMHHPMHLHGHFFRVVNGQGDRAPLKHTVDVEPMATTVIEFLADETGDWLFHCHLLYHMKAGMMNVVHYEGFDPGPAVNAVRPGLYAESWYAWAEVTALSNMAEASATVSDTRNIIRFRGQAGWEGDAKERNHWEGLLTWDRYFNRFFTLFLGAYSGGVRSEEEVTRGVAGFTYVLPFSIEVFAWADDDSGFRAGAHRSFALTPRLELFGEAEYDSHDDWEGRAGLTYLLTRDLSLVGQWHSGFDWGGGLQLRF